jgi:hypothetical protein
MQLFPLVGVEFLSRLGRRRRVGSAGYKPLKRLPAEGEKHGRGEDCIQQSGAKDTHDNNRYDYGGRGLIV